MCFDPVCRLLQRKRNDYDISCRGLHVKSHHPQPLKFHDRFRLQRKRYRTDGMMMAQALDAFSAHFIADCKIAGLLRYMSAPFGRWVTTLLSIIHDISQYVGCIHERMQLQRALKTGGLMVGMFEDCIIMHHYASSNPSPAANTFWLFQKWTFWLQACCFIGLLLVAPMSNVLDVIR